MSSIPHYKILLFGPTGKVGSELLSRLQRDAHHVIACPRQAADLTSPTAIHDAILKHSPDVVINAAAYNGMEACERDTQIADAVNTVAPALMASAARKVDAAFIHYSTDYVFSGDPFGLSEESPIAPSGYYGWTKHQGEIAVSHSSDDYLIFRLSTIYGRAFAGPLDPVSQVRQGRGTRDQPIGILHQRCAPTSARLVADATAYVLATTSREDLRRRAGIYHLATREGVWRADFVPAILDMVCGADPERQFATITLPIPRPVHSVLLTGKFERMFGYPLPDWRVDFGATLPVILGRG